MSEHPSPFELEAWHAEGQPEAAPIAAHVAGCEACSAALDELVAAREALLAREAPDAFARRLRAEAGPSEHRADDRSGWRRLWWVPTAAVALSAAALAIVLSPADGPGPRPGEGPLGPGPGGDVVRLKGDLGLAIVVQPADGPQARHASDVTLAAGDRFRVELTVPSPQVVTVGILQADGAWVPLVEAERREAGVVTLERAFGVDADPLDARVIAGSPEAVAAARERGDLSGVTVLKLSSGP